MNGIRAVRERVARAFFYRERLTRQRRFLDVQILGLEQFRVGWDEITRGQTNHVAGNHLFAIDLDPGVIAKNGCRRSDAAAKLVHDDLRTARLKEVDRRAEDDD